jgi:hypothetical protein
MTNTADTSGAPAAAGAVDPAPKSFGLGQLVRHVWEDPYHADPQTRYGLVVSLPTEGDASVPADEQTSSYGVAWLDPGVSAFPPDGLEAV